MGNASADAILLSIKPVFAKAIMSGKKEYELRKARPRAPTPILVFLYSTRPDMAIVGYFHVPEILEENVQRLWNTVGRFSALTKACFFEYFGNHRMGSAWRIDSPTSLGDPLPLSEIREYDPHYNPPQSMEYMNDRHAAVAALQERGFWPITEDG